MWGLELRPNKTPCLLQLLEFNQTEFVPDGGPDSFDRDGGFVYVPSECVRGGQSCTEFPAWAAEFA